MGRALLRDVSFKPSELLRFLAAIAAVAVVAVVVVLRVTSHGPALAPTPATAPMVLPPPKPAPMRTAEACDVAAWRAAADANAQSLDALAWSPFGRPETGWTIYAPLIAREIGTGCAPQTPGFAGAYAAWQGRQRFAADGIFKVDDFPRLRGVIETRRPFVQLTAKGVCPAPPADAALLAASPGEGYGGKIVSLRASALEAYRRMAAAARAQGVATGDDFKLVSGFRGPVEEAARCADGGCNTVSRASCSAHRTGLAVDIYLGRAAGADPVSSDEANRRAIVQTPAYRWLVANADRFGFVNYPFEPWHWEWTGEAP
ncbi:MAG: D-alanyl-D-alanine carboxypeptidase [Phenylobacterium sp.]|nr:D-alanyl-D-alanine carboxypeptidase [Phenylobacterium sp.]